MFYKTIPIYITAKLNWYFLLKICVHFKLDYDNCHSARAPTSGVRPESVGAVAGTR
jgi:hypothetical protein